MAELNETISVVVPAFNAEKSIGRTLESILAQTRKADEVIVVDDGSTDNTRGETLKFKDAVTYIRQENSGPGAARNTGIKAAKGTWIAFLDSDDEWMPDKLAQQLAMLEAHPDLSWCGASAYNVNEGVETFRFPVEKTVAGLNGQAFFESYFDAVGDGHIIEATGVLVIRRAVFEEVGYFNTEFVRAEDSDMWARIAFAYPKFGYVPKPLAKFHLDVRNPILQTRRKQAKDGKLFRKMVAGHLEKARQTGREASYHKWAAWILRNSLMQTIYHGFKDDARDTVDRFGFLFPRYVTPATYLLTVFPNLTASAAKVGMSLYRRAKMEARITRRWTD